MIWIPVLVPAINRFGRYHYRRSAVIEGDTENVVDIVGVLRRITVHGLRHSHVSLLISKKYDIFEVSKRIGHKSIKTTQDIYGHLFDEVQKTIANDLDSLRRR